jgi:four helix bundle protein
MFPNPICSVEEVSDMQDFRNEDTWKKAHSLALRVYEETKSLPRDETFGIIMQLRQNATAIASAIAAGCGSDENSQAAVDLRQAAARCCELEYMILLAKDLGFWPPTLCHELTMSAAGIRTSILCNPVSN